MAYVFIDTTKNLTIGLLCKEFNWLSYNYYENSKSSQIVHFEIYNLLKKFDVSLLDLKCLFYAAGPGSYTGMRVSEGISQMFKLSGLNVYSFYHYNIPSIMGVPKGRWFSNAFKNECFIHNWNMGQKNQNLISHEDFKVFADDFSYFIDSENSTDLIIKNNPKDFFRLVYESKSQESTYYYREISDEFKVNFK